MKTIINQKKYALIILAIFLVIFNIFAIGKIINKEEVDLSVNPYYYGVGEKGLDINQISGLNKEDKDIDSSIVLTVSPVDQVWYLAYPENKPAFKKIIDSNGFDLINDFTVSEGNVLINKNGEKISYRIYEFENITTLNSYKLNYRQ